MAKVELSSSFGNGPEHALMQPHALIDGVLIDAEISNHQSN